MWQKFYHVNFEDEHTNHNAQINTTTKARTYIKYALAEEP